MSRYFVLFMGLSISFSKMHLRKPSYIYMSPFLQAMRSNQLQQLQSVDKTMPTCLFAILTFMNYKFSFTSSVQIMSFILLLKKNIKCPKSLMSIWFS